MLGGVCAGIAKRFDTDPTLIRVIVIAAAVLTLGTTVLLYIAAWIIMPAGPEAPMARPSRDQLTSEVRDASGRVTEAGRILGRAARQAADEISALRTRPVAAPPVGDEAAGAQAVNEDVLSSDGPPGEGSAPPAYPETQYPTQPQEPRAPEAQAPEAQEAHDTGAQASEPQFPQTQYREAHPPEALHPESSDTPPPPPPPFGNAHDERPQP